MQLNVLVTGANGFIGGYVTSKLLSRNHTVSVVVRRQRAVRPDWRENVAIQPIISDLVDATAELTRACAKADVVVHCAAAMTGDDDTHKHDTLLATEQLVRVMRPGSHLILISSLAVYDYAALSDFAVLDETMPLEQHPEKRDAYCRAKLLQEEIARSSAKERGIALSVLRPGVVFGPGRLWNAHLGIGLGPVLLRIGTKGEVPVSFVEHTAEVISLTAEQDKSVGILNVLDDECPSRSAYVKHLERTGWPKWVIPLPYNLLLLLAAVCTRLPGMPGLLRKPVLAARMKPIRYSNAHLQARLNWRPTMGFEQALRRSAKARVR